MFKKSQISVITITLILFLVITSFFIFQRWFNSFEDDFYANAQGKVFDTNVEITEIMRDTITIRNTAGLDLDIKEIKVNGTNCILGSTSIGKGTTTIEIINCTTTLSEVSTYDVSLVTAQGVKNEYETYREYLDCTDLNGGEWIKVPDDDNLSLKSFCVMKYEAKWDGTGSIYDSDEAYCGNTDYNISSLTCPAENLTIGITSKAATKPMAQVNFYEARKLCRALGTSYDLISGSQWAALARNIENQSTNWVDNTIGSLISGGGGLKRGNAETNNSAGYDGGTHVARDVDTNSKAFHTLSNGDVIWDVAGNLWEWTNELVECQANGVCNSTTMPLDAGPTEGWYEFSQIVSYGQFSANQLFPIEVSYGSSRGVGEIYIDLSWSNQTNSSKNTTHVMARGGSYIEGAGVHTSGFSSGPLNEHPQIGFRCSYSP